MNQPESKTVRCIISVSETITQTLQVEVDLPAGMEPDDDNLEAAARRFYFANRSEASFDNSEGIEFSVHRKHPRDGGTDLEALLVGQGTEMTLIKK